MDTPSHCWGSIFSASHTHLHFLRLSLLSSAGLQDGRIQAIFPECSYGGVSWWGGSDG